MFNIKKYFIGLVVLLVALTHGRLEPMKKNTPMDSVSGTARAAKKKAKAAKKRLQGMADTILDLSASLAPEKIYFQQALSGKLSDEQIMEKFPQGDADLDVSEITSYLPEDMKKMILAYMILFNNATTLGNAIRNIQALSLVSKDLYNMIYENPDIYMPMINHLNRKFGDPQYEIAKLLHHNKAMEYFGNLMFPFGAL